MISFTASYWHAGMFKFYSRFKQYVKDVRLIKKFTYTVIVSVR